MAQHVFIVGLGLIGASMALCIRQTNPELIVVGWDSQSKTREQAVEQQIVDYVANDFETGAEQADVILLAVPVRTTLAYLDVLERINLSDHVIITDVSSTKQQVVTSAEQKNLRFVGGHPMALTNQVYRQQMLNYLKMPITSLHLWKRRKKMLKNCKNYFAEPKQNM